MEALILATALWVIGSAVQQLNAELEQPDPEAGPVLAPRGIAPGRAVVDEHCVRQAIAAKGCLQMALYRAVLFVSAGRKARCKARMIVHDGQGMAMHAIGEPHPAFEIHLPEQVRSLLLEALMRPCGRARRANDKAMPLQNRVHGRSRRWTRPIACKTAHDLARAPGWMGRTHAQHLSLNRHITAPGACMWPARTICEVGIARGKTVKPLVASIRMNPEPPAQLAPVRSFLHREPYKLPSLLHNRHLLPWHGWPPCSRFHARMMCRPCPRTPVGHVPGLYSKRGGAVALSACP